VKAVKKRIEKRIFFFTAVLPLVVFLGCSGVTGKQYIQNAQVEKRYRAREDNNSSVRHGIHIRRYPDGAKAEEVEFIKGKKNGRYTSWYPNGQKKLQCTFVNDLPDGEFTAWFEDGKKRFSVHYDKGQRQDQWIRYHEKGGIVVSMNFDRDKLDGCLSAAFDRGYGNGSGMSYAIKAVFQNGVMVESFHLAYTDPDGHTVIVNGRLLENGGVNLDRQKNVKLADDGTLSVDYGRFRKTYPGLQQFFIHEINRHVMTKFALDFCNRSENIWPCQFPQDTI
jgi:hypothetical protein